MRLKTYYLTVKGIALTTASLVVAGVVLVAAWWVTGSWEWMVIPAGLLVGTLRSAVYKITYEVAKVLLWKLPAFHKIRDALVGTVPAPDYGPRPEKDLDGGFDV